MHHLLLSVFSLLLCTATHSAVRTWDGEAMNHRWDDPVNWVGDLVPMPGDEVLLDNQVIAGDYEVLLPEGDVAVSVARLEILPDAAFTIRLLLPPGNISTTAFRATAAGDAIILHQGSVFINESGATVSSTPVAVTSAGYFRINNGARYIHRTARSATDNLVSRLSAEPGTEQGVFEFDVTVSSYIVSLSGRTFGSLELNSSANTSFVNYRGSGGNVFNVRGDLWLHPEVGFTLSLSSETTIGGTLRIDGSSTFNLQSTDNNNLVRVRGNITATGSITETGTGNPVLVFDGSLPQLVDIGEPLLNQVTVRVDNPSGCDLGQPLFVSHRAELARGIIRSSGVNELRFGPAATCIRDAGLVEGPVRKFRPAGFGFPVGSGSVYAPFVLDALSGTSDADELLVAYHRANPQSVIGNAIGAGDGPVDHISNVEYWSINGSNGLTGRISCTLTPMSFSRTLAGTFITHFEETAWNRKETNITAGPYPDLGYESGELSTVHVIPLRGFISPGTALGFSGNPLPVGLLSFTAVRTGLDEVVLEWMISEAAEAGTRFLIGLRTPGKDTLYRELLKMEADAGRTVFRTGRLPLVPGLNQYRITVYGPGGAEAERRLASVNGDGSGKLQILSVYPNPANGNIWLRVWSARSEQARISIIDAYGQHVKQVDIRVDPGLNQVRIPVQGLAAGHYLLDLPIGDDAVPYRIAFIRQ